MCHTCNNVSESLTNKYVSVYLCQGSGAPTVVSFSMVHNNQFLHHSHSPHCNAQYSAADNCTRASHVDNADITNITEVPGVTDGTDVTDVPLKY